MVHGPTQRNRLAATALGIALILGMPIVSITDAHAACGYTRGSGGWAFVNCESSSVCVVAKYVYGGPTDYDRFPIGPFSQKSFSDAYSYRHSYSGGC